MKILLEKSKKFLNKEISKSEFEKILDSDYCISTAADMQYAVDKMNELMEEDEILVYKEGELSLLYDVDYLVAAEECRKCAIEAHDPESSIYCEMSWPKGGSGIVRHLYVNDYLEFTDIPSKFHDFLYENVGRIEIDDLLGHSNYYVQIKDGLVIVDDE